MNPDSSLRMKSRTKEIARWAACLFLPLIAVTIASIGHPPWVGFMWSFVWGVISALIAPFPYRHKP